MRVLKTHHNCNIICKYYYMRILKEELASPTYSNVAESEADLVSQHTTDLVGGNITVNEEDKKVPHIYWTSKQHKSPPSERFIVSGVHCSTKTLSKKLSCIFKLVQKTLKNYCNYRCKFMNTASFWIINSPDKVHQHLDYINHKNSARSIYTYDFSKLYTNIPHDLLLCKIKLILDKVISIYPDKKYVKITSNGAYWSKTKGINTSKTTYWDFEEIFKWFEYLINNIYIKFDGKIYKQIIGLPMGTDCAPDLANLFLFSYEFTFVEDMIAENDENLSKLKYCSRYIDDLLALNDGGFFDKMFETIYPSELQLNNTNISNKESNYLDMNISIDSSNKFEYKLYDKRQDFSFKVVSLPNLASNIPVSAAYSVFYSQIIRIFYANNNIEHFYTSVVALIKKLCSQNFERNKLIYQIHKFNRNFYPKIIFKFWTVLDLGVFR